MKTQDFKPKHDKSQVAMEAEMERLNSKYNPDCFSDSELDSEWDEGEQYHYEHGYETFIWKWKMKRYLLNLSN